MAVANKVRVYDLARELKQDTKRIIEDLRREGADVDVPSNSVPKELADKVRNKYFPKKETAPVRAIKVIKKAKHVEEETPVVEEPVIETPEEAPEEETPVVVEAQPVPEVEEAAPAKADKQVRKLKKPAVVETVEEEEVEEEAPEEAEPVIAEVEEVVVPVKAPEVKVVKSSTQVKQIRISADALKTIKASEEAKVAARVPKVVEAPGARQERDPR